MVYRGCLEFSEPHKVYVATLFVQLPNVADLHRCGGAGHGATAQEAWDKLKERFKIDGDLEPLNDETKSLLWNEPGFNIDNIPDLAKDVYYAFHGGKPGTAPDYDQLLEGDKAHWTRAIDRALFLARHKISLHVEEKTPCAACGDRRRLVLYVPWWSFNKAPMLAACLFCLQRNAKIDVLPMQLPGVIHL